MAGPRKSEAVRWYHQSLFDLKACRWNIEGGFHNSAAFLAQQAAEKALKSLPYYSGSRRRALLTHSLIEMLASLEKSLPVLSDLREEARILDLHYIPSRYPNGLPSGYPHQFYGRETAMAALRAAERLIDAVTVHYRARGEQDMLLDEPADS